MSSNDVEEEIGSAIESGVENDVDSSVDDAIFAQKTVRLLDRWGANRIETYSEPDGGHTVEFYPPFPGDQPIRSYISFDDGFEKATIRYGVLDPDAFPRHPQNIDEQVDRIVDTTAAVQPRPPDVLVLANYGDDHWPPRPHLLIGWAPVGAKDYSVMDKEQETVQERGDDPSLTPGELVDYVRRVGEAYREEFAADYAGVGRDPMADRDILGEIEQEVEEATGGNHDAVVELEGGGEVRFGGAGVGDLSLDVTTNLADAELHHRVSASENIVGDGWSSVDISAEIAEPVPEDAYPPMYDQDVYANLGARYKGLPGMEDDIEGAHLSHLWVDGDHRGKGWGKLLFDIYLAFAAWAGGTASGKFGEEDGGSREFLTSMGIPDDAITDAGGAWVTTETVHFEFDVDDFLDENDWIYVE